MITKSIICLIRLYQRILSPWWGGRCRYYPSCSHYAVEAIQVHGLLIGLKLSVSRICRCHPFQSGGIDAVPPKTRCQHNECPGK